MLCASCGTRKARRGCPALGASICPVCCGTKRRVEIACPDDCGWLRTTAAHPPAARQRQAEEDRERLRALLGGLTEPEYVVLTAALQETLRFRQTALPAPHDVDVRDAAAALRATYETEARGVVYEHRPDALVAGRLMDALRQALDRLASEGFPRPALHARGALRRLERLASRPTAGGPGATDFLDFVERVLRPHPDAAQAGEQLAASALAELGGAARAPDERSSGGSRIILP